MTLSKHEVVRGFEPHADDFGAAGLRENPIVRDGDRDVDGTNKLVIVDVEIGIESAANRVGRIETARL